MALSQKNILVIDDEKNICTLFADSLQQHGFHVSSAGSIEEARKAMRSQSFFLIFLDVFLAGENSVHFITELKENSPSTQIIVMTGQGGMSLAISAIKGGAKDYLTKPIDLKKIDEISLKIYQASKKKEEAPRPQQSYEAGELVGKSASIEKVFKQIAFISSTDISVLIRGESGTGKELAARAIHNNSSRKNNPFIAINCAAIPETLMASELFGHKKGSFTSAVQSKKGAFELANNGTIFLDEIGDMPIEMQAAILRVLQEMEFYPVGSERSQKVNVRVIAATNRSLEEQMEQNCFREDLFYRLNEATLQLPPLRKRRGDIPLLTEHFLCKYAEKMHIEPKGISRKAMACLEQQEWRGNIRELENVVKYALSLTHGTQVEVEDLPERYQSPHEAKGYFSEYILENIENLISENGSKEKGTLYKDIMGTVEQVLLSTIYQKTGYNQVTSSRILGINRNTFRTKIKELGLDKVPSSTSQKKK